MALTSLIGKIKHLKQHYVFQHMKEKVQNLLVSLSKLEGSPPRIIGTIFNSKRARPFHIKLKVQIHSQM
jgi:hypothetical protein